MKKLNLRINNLWQCQSKELGGKASIWLSFIFCIMFAFFSISMYMIRNDNCYVVKIVFGYCMLLTFMLSVTFLSTYFYVYSKKEFGKRIKRLIIFLYKCLLTLCFLVMFPGLVYIQIMQIFLKRKAKKMDNFEVWLLILGIDFMVMLLATKPNFYLAFNLLNIFIRIVGSNLNTYAIILGLALALLKAEWEITNFIALKIMNGYGIAKIKKSIGQIESDCMKKLTPEADIEEYSKMKKDTIDKEKKKKEEELAYDLAYQKATLWKFQLICLIGLFFIATFTDKLLFESQSDAINVITVFTLVMLYSDKSRAWDKELLGLDDDKEKEEILDESAKIELLKM